MAKVPQPDRPGADDPGRGRRLGLDVGTVRIGVAVSDPDCILATPVETVRAVTKRKDPDGADIDRLLELIDEYDAVEVIIGLPRTLSGGDSSSIKVAAELGFRINRRLKQRTERPQPALRWADERLTTVSAQAALHASGVSTKAGRAIIDQAAAVEILQSWLDQRRATIARVTEM
ncbi:Holliday junction resolvase RuvX [Corynebacterium ulceribovis]|uniref:Holliday junction resolvase RuvX n=1 Tax=Corynebacterium ulceribovis TaxID=487732 RepID=UPI00037ED1EE|nr:Holliday junction resolvase RuvX [Corynebacterium ulceribovis]